MNNPEQVAQSFLQAYYQAFVTNRAGLSGFYVKKEYKLLFKFILYSMKVPLLPWKEILSLDPPILERSLQYIHT